MSHSSNSTSALTLRIGRLSWSVASYAEAVEIYCNCRDGLDLGAHELPQGRVGGYSISYNGRMWAGAPRAWKSGDVPVSPAELDAQRAAGVAA